jgi:transcriptional regulator GlxA family with amidase domain
VAPSYVHLLAAKDLIDRNYAEPLDTARLARAALISQFHFIRAFRGAFGETPHQYLLRRRIERAQELLRATNLTVTEISLEVGFRSLGSFTTAFGEHAGEPPSAYRERWMADGPPPIPACFTLMWARPTRAVSEKRGGGDGTSVEP